MEEKKKTLLPGIRSVYDWTASGICLFAFLFWVILLTYKYYYFGYYDWDLAMYAQAMWGLLHGSLTPSIFGINFLANHAEYITFTLVPIYFLFSHPLTLIYLKLFSFISGAYIFFMIGRKSIEPLGALILMILYLLFPANIFAVLYEFHFESLNIGLLFLLFYFFQSQKFIPFCITMFFVSMIKENMPPIIVAFGIYAFFSRRENKILWSLVPILWGIGIFYVSMFLITPALRVHLNSVNYYLGMYEGIGRTPAEIAKTFLFHPFTILSIILQPHNLAYLKELFGPLLFIPLFSPHILFLISPIFLQHLLSSGFQEQTIYYHYAATIVPFIFLATLQSLRFIRTKIKPLFYYIIFSLMVLSCAVNLGFYKKDIALRISRFEDRLDPIRWQMVKEIPPDKGVIATLSFLAELSQRKHVYSFLNILKNADGFSGQSFNLPASVSYALIDWDDGWIKSTIFLNPVANPQQILKRIQDFLSAGWVIKDAVDSIVLLQKGKDNQLKLIERARVPFLKSMTKSRPIIIDDAFSFLKYEINQNRFDRSHVLPLTFYWQSQHTLHQNYLMTILLRRDNKTVFLHTRWIGYTIVPTSIWEKGDYIKEHYWLLLPAGLAAGEYSIELNFFNQDTNQVASIKFSNATEIQGGGNNTLKIGKIFIK